MKIKEKFLEEKLEMLCIICHRMEEGSLFLDFKERILKKYLSNYR